MGADEGGWGGGFEHAGGCSLDRLFGRDIFRLVGSWQRLPTRLGENL